jgi:hypothetical protein
MPVWIADSPSNRLSAEQLRRGRHDVLNVTTFRFDPQDSPEGRVAGILGTVDLHHGHYSQAPPYSVIEVFGASLTPALRRAFSEYGLSHFRERAGGFRAGRTADAVKT